MKQDRRIYSIAIILVLGLVVACTKGTLKYEKAEDLGKIEEYDKLVKVKEIEAPVPSPTPATTATPSPTPTKREKAKKKETPTAKRLPPLEDSEGFEGRRPLKDPYQVGESVTLMMTYFGVSAGDMTLKVLPFKEVNGRRAYHFHVTLKSSSLFSMIYSVDDWAESLFDYEDMRPYTFSVHAVETKKLLEVRTFFDWKSKKAQRWERTVTKEEGPKEKKKDWDIPDFAQNIFSGVYYLRAFTLRPGKTVKFVVADDTRNYTVSGEVLRREKLKTDLGVIDTVVIKPTVYLENIFQPMGTVLVWFTDDDQKLMVKLEAEVKIGKLVGYLKAMDRGK